MYNGRSPGARRAAPKKGPSLLPYQDRRLGSEIINLSHTAVRIASIPDLIRLKHRETLPDDWGAGWEGPTGSTSSRSRSGPLPLSGWPGSRR